VKLFYWFSVTKFLEYYSAMMFHEWTMRNHLWPQNANDTRQRRRQRESSSKISLKSLGLIESAVAIFVFAGLNRLEERGTCAKH
jgi:hypothetical protein